MTYSARLLTHHDYTLDASISTNRDISTIAFHSTWPTCRTPQEPHRLAQINLDRVGLLTLRTLIDEELQA